jgi:signal peptidase I
VRSLRGRLGVERVIVGLSSGAVLLSLAWVRPSDAVAACVVMAAIIWGVAPAAIDAFLTPAHASITPRPGRESSVTTILCVGAEPLPVVRASIILARQVGPTSVATATRPQLADELRSVEVPVFVAETLDDALRDAVGSVQTEAVLLTSGSAFPTTAVSAVAGLLEGAVGWVVGRVEPFAPDPFDPGAHDDHEARMRSAARAGGLILWEPDATIVRTELIRQLDLEPRRPRGTWLRSLHERGFEGVEQQTVLARRTAPTDGPLFWTSEVMRRRGVTADLAEATRIGPLRTRLLALARLLRELSAYQLVLWLSVPVLITRSDAFPFDVAAWSFVVMHGSLAMARWVAVRQRVGTELHPIREILSTVYDAPASLAAVSALGGRIRPTRIRFPDQPLLLAAIALTLVVSAPLLDRPATADRGIDATAGFAVVALGLLWACAIHAVGPRAWGRSSYRLAIDAAAEVDGEPGRLKDASPSGAAVVGEFGPMSVGTEVSVSVSFPHTSRVVVPATVVDRRSAGPQATVLGLALQLDSERRIDWIEAMSDAAQLTDAHAELSRPALRLWRRRPEVEVGRRSRARSFVRHLEWAMVGAISLAIGAALVLSVVGYRPLVVRSGSMAPSLEVGDVAIVDWRLPGDIEVGDVVTFVSLDVDAQSVTHRVQAVDATGGNVTFETRGDANESSETWSVPEAELIGLVVGRVPMVGGTIAGLGRLNAVIAGVGMALVLLAALVARGHLGRMRLSRRGRDPEN